MKNPKAAGSSDDTKKPALSETTGSPTHTGVIPIGHGIACSVGKSLLSPGTKIVVGFHVEGGWLKP